MEQIGKTVAYAIAVLIFLWPKKVIRTLAAKEAYYLAPKASMVPVCSNARLSYNE